MDEQKLKAFIKDLLQPVFDKIIDECYQYTLLIEKNFPEGTPDEEKQKQVEALIKAQQKSFTVSAVDINKIKEALKNGKR